MVVYNNRDSSQMGFNDKLRKQKSFHQCRKITIGTTKNT